MPNSVPQIMSLIFYLLYCAYLALVRKIQGSIRGAESLSLRWPISKKSSIQPRALY